MFMYCFTQYGFVNGMTYIWFPVFGWLSSPFGRKSIPWLNWGINWCAGAALSALPGLRKNPMGRRDAVGVHGSLQQPRRLRWAEQWLLKSCWFVAWRQYDITYNQNKGVRIEYIRIYLRRDGWLMINYRGLLQQHMVFNQQNKVVSLMNCGCLMFLVDDDHHRISGKSHPEAKTRR
jgi:hypothetical protein